VDQDVVHTFDEGVETGVGIGQQRPAGMISKPLRSHRAADEARVRAELRRIDRLGVRVGAEAREAPDLADESA